MNKKIFALCCMLSTLGTHMVAASNAPKSNAVTISISAGIGRTHSASIENQTEALPDIADYAPVQDATTKLYTNTYVKLNQNFTQAYYYTTGTQTTVSPENGWYVNNVNTATQQGQSIDNTLFPTFGNTQAITIGTGTNEVAPEQLNNYANYARIRTVAAAIDYSQVQELIGATGVDVGGALGYKMHIDKGVYIHPSFKFGYMNAKSQNAINSRYQEASFWTKNVIVANAASSATATAATQLTMYGLDPETTASQGFGGLVANAVTFQAQWYWNFITAIGYELAEGVSIEGQIGYQMTRFKLSAMEVDNEVEGIQSIVQPYNQDSTLNSAYALKNDVELYNINNILIEGEESTALLISGLYMGFGFNFNIAKNLTLGMNMYHVFNAKRNFAIESLTIAPTVKASSTTTTQQNTTGQTGTQNAQQTAGTEQSNDAIQDLSIDAAQDISGLNMALTYSIPVGTNNCAPAA